jgi:hypothetical protein
MTEPSLALQKAIRERLVATGSVTGLVPADSILDRNAQPEVFPCVLLGEGQTLNVDEYDIFHPRVHVDVHVWVQENSLTGAKTIVDAIREALKDGQLSADGFRVLNVSTGARFLRDPRGDLSHAVFGIDVIMLETA